MQYLVTTDINRLREVAGNRQIIMVDGTVPGYVQRDGDYHYDHHRQNGEAVQIDEINPSFNRDIKQDAVIVTTQVDADACVAAAWLLGSEWYYYETVDSEMQLKAIAYDCDHLVVPDYLSEYVDFAAKAVAAMKSNSDSLVTELNLPTKRNEWTKDDKEKFASKAFEQGVSHILDAIQGKRKYPGENGEADKYIEKLNQDITIWETSSNILTYRDVLIFDCTSVIGYLDPRVTLRAAKNTNRVTSQPFTVTQRRIVNNNEFLGYSYTIGVVPLHENIDTVDYVGNKVFEALTLAELKNDINNFDASVKNANLWGKYETLDIYEQSSWLCSPEVKLGWGGRKTVGGSSWNTPSKLAPQTIIDVILENSGEN